VPAVTRLLPVELTRHVGRHTTGTPGERQLVGGPAGLSPPRVLVDGRLTPVVGERIVPRWGEGAPCG
jgi:hypothetical protein